MADIVARLVLKSGLSKDTPILQQAEPSWDSDTQTLRVGDDTPTPAKVPTTQSTGIFDLTSADLLVLPAVSFPEGATIGGIDLRNFVSVKGIVVVDKGNVKNAQITSSDGSLVVQNADGVGSGPIELDVADSLKEQITQFANTTSIDNTFLGYYQSLLDLQTAHESPEDGSLAVIGDTRSMWFSDPILGWTNTTPVYVGATDTSSGTQGFVPPASSSERNFALRGDGTWKDVPSLGLESIAILNGTILPSGGANILIVDTEAGAASDNLDTIDPTYMGAGRVVSLRPANAGRTVVIKHNTGNIKLASGVDFSLNAATKTMTLFYDEQNNVWNEQSNSDSATPWGSITGTLASQTDVVSALGAKVNDSAAGAYALTMLNQVDITATLLSLGLAAAASRTVGLAVGNLVEVITGGKLPVIDGSNLTGLVTGGIGDYQVFTANGTWTKPTSGIYPKAWVLVQVWAGGGSSSGDASSGGGGGGAYNEKWYALTDLGATVSVTVGAGGAAVGSGVTRGLVGGNSNFGAAVYAYGGGEAVGYAGTYAYSGGCGGGIGSAGQCTGDGGSGGGPYGAPFSTVFTHSVYGGGGGGCYNQSVFTGDSYCGGGGGAAGNGTATDASGGSSVWGGGGGRGGVSGNTKGVSVFGGSGGAGGVGGAPGAGAIPAGGAGGSSAGNNSRAGGRGEIRVNVYAY